MHDTAIGNWRLVSCLGRGGMGEVWLARQHSTDGKVAIKLLDPRISEDTAQIQRFFNEARAVGKIRHAGIVQIFDAGLHEGRAYLVMEYLDGEPLARRAKRARLSIRRVAEVCRQIASILEATHRAGITHRDLKPDNVYLVSDEAMPSRERVKLLDFGIAKLSGPSATASSPATLGTMGTPAYMAPEQWGDSSRVDGRADLYSLGCLAFELACGRPPFVTATFAEACAAHLHDPPPHANELAPGVPAALDALIDRLLAKDAAARPTVGELAAAFDAIADAEPADVMPAPRVAAEEPVRFDAPTALASIAAPTRAPRRRWIRLAAVGGAIAVAAGTLVALRDPQTRAIATPLAVRAIDAAPIPIDAPPPPPPPPPSPPPPIDAAVLHRAPPSEIVDDGDVPDEIDIAKANAANDVLWARVQHCGAFEPGVPVTGAFHIGSNGRVVRPTVVAPTPAIAACITRLIEAARFPRSKPGLDVDANYGK